MSEPKDRLVHIGSFPKYQNPKTQSRPFNDREQSILIQLIRKFIHLSPWHMNQRLMDIEKLGRFAGNTVWKNLNVLGPFFLVSLKFQNLTNGTKLRLSRRNNKLFRQDLTVMFKGLAGEQYITGFRLNPHTGPQAGQHVHVLIGLLCFHKNLRPWARAFRFCSEETKKQWIDLFFDGKYLVQDQVQKALEQQYPLILQKHLKGFRHDPSVDLVHIQSMFEEQSTEEAGKCAVDYGEDQMDCFDDFEIKGYFPDQKRQVLLKYKDGRTISIEEKQFVLDSIVYPPQKWIRRGCSGYLHQQSSLFGIMNYASQQPHPMDPEKNYFDRSAYEITEYAQEVRMNTPKDLPVPSLDPVPAEMLPPKPTQINNSFPKRNFPEPLMDWPFYRLELGVPRNGWGNGILLDQLKDAQKVVANIISRKIIRKRIGGFIIFPSICRTKQWDRVVLNVFLSKIIFQAEDRKLAKRYIEWDRADVDLDLLAAFFRNPYLAIGHQIKKRIQWEWARYLTDHLNLPPTDDRYWKLIRQPKSIGHHLKRALGVTAVIQRQFNGLQIIQTKDLRYHYVLKNGTASENTYVSYQGLGKHLDEKTSEMPIHPYGFFTNQNRYHSKIVSTVMLCQLPINDLVEEASEAHKRLCSDLGYIPPGS